MIERGIDNEMVVKSERNWRELIIIIIIKHILIRRLLRLWIWAVVVKEVGSVIGSRKQRIGQMRLEKVSTLTHASVSKLQGRDWFCVSSLGV